MGVGGGDGGGVLGPQVTVYQPDGTAQTTLYEAAGTLTLSQTGRSTLRVYDAGGDPGDYKLTLEWIAPVAKQCTSPSISCGAPVTSTLDVNDHDLRTFAGTAGDVVWVSVVGTAGAYLRSPGDGVSAGRDGADDAL